MSNGLHYIFTCFYALFDIVFMKHNVIYVFVILVDDAICVVIHNLYTYTHSVVFTEHRGLNSQHRAAVQSSRSHKCFDEVIITSSSFGLVTEDQKDRQ